MFAFLSSLRLVFEWAVIGFVHGRLGRQLAESSRGFGAFLRLVTADFRLWASAFATAKRVSCKLCGGPSESPEPKLA